MSSYLKLQKETANLKKENAKLKQSTKELNVSKKKKKSTNIRIYHICGIYR